MHCPKCGTEAMAEAVYCHQCGARLDGSDSGPSQPPTATGDAAASDPQGMERVRAVTQSRGSAANEVEQERWQGSFSPRAMTGRWIGIGVLAIVLLLVGSWLDRYNVWQGWTLWVSILGVVVVLTLYTLLVLARRRFGVRYRLTSQRFYLESGILWHVTDRLDVFEIDDISCHQNVLDRILGIGDIRITSTDREHAEVLLRGIENAPRVAAMIDEVRRSEQIRRGVLIEQD
jgi:membrane protein YdbS with pleckstrin-like domain